MAAKRTAVTVVIDDEKQGSRKVLSGVVAAGLKKAKLHEELGLISGEIDEKDRAKVKGVKGVVDVENEQSYEVPPPNSDVQ